MTLTAKAAYKYFNFIADTSTGKPLVGYYVQIFNAGTNTPSDTWTDDTATIPAGDNITSDTNGYFETYLAPDFYDLKVYGNETDYLANTNPTIIIENILHDGFTTATASSTAFTPNGDIAATDTQAAIQEVRDEYQDADAAIIVTTDNLQAQINALTITWTEQVFTTVAAQTVFTLTTPYIVGGKYLFVYINGAYQPTTSYTETNTTTVTFTNAIPIGKEVIFKYGTI